MKPTDGMIDAAEEAATGFRTIEHECLARICRAITPFVLDNAARVVEADISADELRLQGGELTAQEVRTAQAFLRSRAIRIRAMKEDGNE